MRCGTRRYILVQLPESLDTGNENQRTAAEFCDKIGQRRSIAELTKERLRRAAKRVKDEKPMFSGDFGFRVFKLDTSNVRAWEPDQDNMEGTLLQNVDHIKIRPVSIVRVLYQLIQDSVAVLGADQHGLIVDIDATQAGSDYQQLTPAIQRLEQSMHRAPEQMVVDGGYISSNNITEMAKRDIDFVGPQSENKAAEANRRKSYKHHGVSPEYEASKFVFDTETNTYVCPQGKHLRYDAKQESHGTMCYRYKASEQDCQTCPAKDQCCPRTRHGRSIERRELLPDIAAFRQKMQTDETKAIYKTRSQVAEFPNLWIKAKFGLRQFSVRRIAKVRTESQWVALTYDILQWIRLRWRPKMVSALAPT